MTLNFKSFLSLKWIPIAIFFQYMQVNWRLAARESSTVLIIVLFVLKCFLEKFKVSFAYLPCNVNRVSQENTV